MCGTHTEKSGRIEGTSKNTRIIYVYDFFPGEHKIQSATGSHKVNVMYVLYSIYFHYICIISYFIKLF